MDLIVSQPRPNRTVASPLPFYCGSLSQFLNRRWPGSFSASTRIPRSFSASTRIPTQPRRSRVGA
eukprot:12218139-Karenia_brevis.AAC.1